LTANIAAIAHISKTEYRGKTQNVFIAAVLFSLGQTAAFVLLTFLVLGIPFFSGDQITRTLATYLHPFLAAVFFLAGLMLFGFIRFSMTSISEKAAKQMIERFGFLSPLFLGMLLACTFCPTSAATFLAMLTLTADSGSRFCILLYPLLFGLGVSLPVMFCAVLLSFPLQYCSRFFQIAAGIDKPLRYSTGTIFIAAGMYLLLN
jgi:cytochrome c biogenesis protein CcdA